MLLLLEKLLLFVLHDDESYTYLGDHIGKPTVKVILSWVSVPLLAKFPANGECACAMYCTIWPHMCKNVK